MSRPRTLSDEQRRERNAAKARANRARNAARSTEDLAAARATLGATMLCPGCDSDLPLDAFAADASKASGLRFVCRSCDAAARPVRAARAEARSQALATRARLEAVGYSRRPDPVASDWEERGVDRCVYCGDPAVEIDHIMPRIRGGLDVVSNTVPACRADNASKKHRDLFVWRPDLLALVADWPVEIRY
jgi:hypothetical protein